MEGMPGRQGLGTELTELTKGLIAGQEAPRHSTVTTGRFYKMKTQNTLTAGMKLLSEATDEAINRSQGAASQSRKTQRSRRPAMFCCEAIPILIKCFEEPAL
jgi:hypothetical protein